MSTGRIRIYKHALLLLLAFASAGYLALELHRNHAALIEAPLLPLALMLAAALAAYLGSMRAGSPAVRLSCIFVIAGILLLPAPAGLLIAIAALAVGRGAGVAGLYDKGIPAFVAAAAAVALAQLNNWQIWPAVSADTFDALLRGAIAFCIIQLSSMALSFLLYAEKRHWSRKAKRALLRCVLLEMLNIPAAWMLAGLLARTLWVQAAVLGGLVLAGEYTLLRLASTLGALKDSRDALASRMSELETLHAIGREVLSSMEPARVFAVIERECRKIIDVDYFYIALAEPDSSQISAVYRHRRESAAERAPLALKGGLASLVAREKRGVRIDDLRNCQDRTLLDDGIVEGSHRSAMAVPLVVEERVTGVLAVHSNRAGVYDDHKLSVLTTVAQQAAVAIENARHYKIATVDSLTGFQLRDPFFKRLNEEYRRASRYGGRFSLLMIDLDQFKEINDHNGHLGGDRYLQSVSSTIREQLRSADIPCRYGGDEFCMLLPETDLAGAQTIAERIRVAVARHIAGFEGAALRTTASIGIASYPEHGAPDARSLLRLADEALYRAKSAGRDCVVASAV
jgi:diguanylate cyclase (GGDEF)-like protein